MTRARVIGVGSPAGDDRVGWLVVEALRETPALAPALADGRLDLLTLDRPGAELVRHLRHVEHVLVVDAVLADQPPGTLLELDAADLEASARPLSAHTLGVAEALALARALGEAPATLALLAVQPARTGPLDAPSAAVLAVVPAAAARVVARLTEWLAG